MAVIEAAVTSAVRDAWGTRCTLTGRHREMAEGYRRLSTIMSSSTEVRNYNLRIAAHYSLLAEIEEGDSLA